MKELNDIEHVTKAYNLVSALHTEALLENARLQKQLDRIASKWYLALAYHIKRKLGLIKDADL
jgi:butyrate kinase